MAALLAALFGGFLAALFGGFLAALFFHLGVFCFWPRFLAAAGRPISGGAAVPPVFGRRGAAHFVVRCLFAALSLCRGLWASFWLWFLAAGVWTILWCGLVVCGWEGWWCVIGVVVNVLAPFAAGMTCSRTALLSS